MPLEASITPQMIIDDMTRCLGRPAQSNRAWRYQDYRERGGHYPVSTITRHLGGWGWALNAWRSGKVPQPEPPQERQRQCLLCDRWFKSWGPGNRRCDRHNAPDTSPEPSYQLLIAENHGGWRE